MAVYKVVAEWTGFTGAPGYTVLHFSAIEVSQALAQSAAGAVSSMFGQIALNLPAVVNVRVQSTVDVLNEATGNIEDSLTITPAAATVGQATGGFSGVSGACIHWLTPDFKRGRRVRGKSFLVPLASSAYEANGTLSAGVISTLQGAADNLLTKTPVLQVFSRPTSAGASDGSAHTVTRASVPDKAVVLRSRRD